VIGEVHDGALNGERVGARVSVEKCACTWNTAGVTVLSRSWVRCALPRSVTVGEAVLSAGCACATPHRPANASTAIVASSAAITNGSIERFMRPPLIRGVKSRQRVAGALRGRHPEPHPETAAQR